jgi:hypothetical protein
MIVMDRCRHCGRKLMWCDGVIAIGWFHEYPGIVRDCLVPELEEDCLVIEDERPGKARVTGLE